MSDSADNGPNGAPRILLSDFEEWNGFLVYKGKIPFDELPFPEPVGEEDFDWAFNDPDVCARYEGLIVAVLNRRVWGAGKDYGAAWDDARKQPDCPPHHELVFVPVCSPP